MTWIAPEVSRTHAPIVAPERASLEGWLDFHRQTLRFKCQGLSGEQLAQRAVAPSTMSLLGLVRHMSEVERGWFRRRFGGQSHLTWIYCTQEQPDNDFDLAKPDGAEADFATFTEECELARQAAEGHSLDETFKHPDGETIDLRWVYLHMIEEYARHNGHADILREQIDGAVGS